MLGLLKGFADLLERFADRSIQDVRDPWYTTLPGP
jgi:hypothetical protein